MLASDDGAEVEDVAAMLDTVLIHASNMSDDLEEAREALAATAASLEEAQANRNALDATSKDLKIALDTAAGELAARAELLQTFESQQASLQQEVGHVACGTSDSRSRDL